MDIATAASLTGFFCPILKPQVEHFSHCVAGSMTCHLQSASQRACCFIAQIILLFEAYSEIYKTDLFLLIQHNPNEGPELKTNHVQPLAGHFSLIHIESI